MAAKSKIGTSLAQRRANLAVRLLFRREELYRASLARCLVLVGLMLLASGLVGLGDDNSDASLAIAMGSVIAAAGLVGVLLHQLPESAARQEIFVAAALLWLVVIGFSVLFYALSGAFDSVDAALFESVAGFSTTSFSVFPDPSQLSDTLLFWRAGTQWMGGIGALFVSLLLIPLFYAHKSQKSQDGQTSSTDKVFFDRFWRHQAEFLNYLGLYGLLTLALFVGYWLFGMGSFDALTYAFTTVSSGGLANHTASLGHFGSAGIEWVAIAGMLLAGINGALLFKALRGKVGPLWRSLEFKVYCGVVVGATWVFFMVADTTDATLRLREAALVVTSAVSTTGFRLVDWTLWNDGLQLLLMALVATGAMAGSISGGFQILRATEAGQYLWGEILRHGNPTSGSRRVLKHLPDADSLSRMQAYQMTYLTATACGAFALACFGNDVITSLSGAISALATMGPALGDLGPSADLHVLSRPEQALMATMMLFGRLFFYPVLIIVGTLQLKIRWLQR